MIIKRPLTCADDGHFWTRVVAELGSETRNYKPRNFTCARSGCDAIKTEHWKGNRWHQTVLVPVKPSPVAQAEPPADPAAYTESEMMG